MEIRVSDEIKELCPDAALGILRYEADIAPASPEFSVLFEDTVKELSEKLTTDMIAGLPHIASTRQAYKALGKSPQEYRNASEAMLRRIVKGNGLYRINNVVDINNLVSVTSGYSIGSYDTSQLQGDILLQRAEDDAHYAGIGKASVNIGHLPTLYDARGAFGNPTSDSTRAMVTSGRHEMMSVLYSFDGTEDLAPWIARFAQLLGRYCGAASVQTMIV